MNLFEKTKTVAITGATGFIGSNLQRKFRIAGCKTIALGRSDFEQSIDQLADKLAEADVIINLAGAPVIGRWTKEYKKTLFESRITLTTKLVKAISQMKVKPEVFISTSAIGIYQDTGTHDEDSTSLADSYLGNLAVEWEKAALGAKKLGIRTVIFRLGVVLGKNGGALKKMLPPFKLGLGGVIGSGDQAFSWIHHDDVIDAYEVAVKDVSYSGIYNLTAPEPTTNRGFTEELGQVLSKPTFIPVPEFILNILFGEGAQILTGGQSVYPKRLLEAGFTFSYGKLKEALNNCLY